MADLGPWARARKLEIDLARSQAYNHQLLQAHEGLKELLNAEAQRVDTLTEIIVRMKREGFSSSPLPQQVEPPTPLPEGVWQALEVAQEPGLEEWARHQLEHGADPKDVAKKILDGGSIPL